VSLGVTPEGVAERLEALLAAAGLPTGAPQIELDEARNAMMQDKKIATGRLRLPVVRETGRADLIGDVDPRTLCGALEGAIRGS